VISPITSAITGIGWISQREYGCVMKSLRRPYLDMGSLRSELQGQSILSYPLKRFGKYDLVSKLTCCVSALALHDAELSYSETEKQDVGILGTNTQGCLQSNVDYFQDFVVNGRTRGRGSLFIYTLSSIPVAEAAMYFNCRGPLLYMASPGREVASLVSQSDGMIRREEATGMLAVQASEEQGLCFVLRREQDIVADRRLPVDEVVRLADSAPPLDALVAALAETQDRNNA